MSDTLSGASPFTHTTTCYGYGRRITKSAGAVTTVFVNDAAGQLAAEYGGPANPDSGTVYLTQDHLGATRLVMDSAGTCKRTYDYLPFGEEIYSGVTGRGTCFELGL